MPAQQTEEGGQAGGLAHQIEPVSHPGDKGAVRNDDLSVLPLRRAQEHRQLSNLVGLGGQRLVGQEIALPDPEAHQLHTAPAEGLNVGGAGEAEQAGDFHGGGVFRTDGQVDAQLPLHVGQLHGILHVAYPGDGEFGTQLLGGETTDHVDLIQAGCGNKHVRRLRAGFLQNGDGGAVALDTHDVQRLRGVAQGIVVGVDHCDVVLLLRQMLRQCKTDLAISHNDDLQAISILSGRQGPLKTRCRVCS